MLQLPTRDFLRSTSLLEVELTLAVNLKCTIRKDKNVYLIYISAKSIPHLRSLIKDFMHPTMLYKLGL